MKDSVTHLLHQAGQKADEAFAVESAAIGLTPRQFVVLLAISELDKPSQTAITSRTGVDRSTLDDIVRRLVKMNLVHRRRTKEDARAYALRLTDDGSKALHSAKSAAKAADDAILSCLAKAEAANFVASLKKIVAAQSA